MTEAMFAGASILFLIWGLYNYLGYRKEKREIKQKYEDLFQAEERGSFISILGNKFDKTSFASEFRKRLVHANISLLPSEFFAIMLLCALMIGVVFNAIFSIALLASAVLSLLVCIFLYFIIFVLRKNKYMEKINNQLSEVCRILGNSTRAGMTITQGIEVVAQELSNPAREEFRNLAHNLRLGVSFERGLKDLEKRVPSREFKLFISTLLIQKKSGGNLSAVLDEMAKTLEERKILRQTIKTMTAEQRFVSYILPFFPFVLILMLNSMMEGFLDPLLTIPGIILSIVFLIGMIIAFFLVRAVTNIKV